MRATRNGSAIARITNTSSASRSILPVLGFPGVNPRPPDARTRAPDGGSGVESAVGSATVPINGRGGLGHETISTGVPTKTRSKRSSTSRMYMRMHPCEAAVPTDEDW